MLTWAISSYSELLLNHVWKGAKEGVFWVLQGMIFLREEIAAKQTSQTPTACSNWSPENDPEEARRVAVGVSGWTRLAAAALRWITGVNTPVKGREELEARGRWSRCEP